MDDSHKHFITVTVVRLSGKHETVKIPDLALEDISGVLDGLAVHRNAEEMFFESSCCEAARKAGGFR